MEQKFQLLNYGTAFLEEEVVVQAAIDRVMQTYTMIVNLSAEEERKARQIVANYLSGKSETDEHALAVEGLRYLRSVRE
jgi:hypothetical protein